MPSALSFLIFPKASDPTITRRENIFTMNNSDETDPDIFARRVIAMTNHPKINVSFHWDNANWSIERDWQTIMAVVTLKDAEPIALIEAMRDIFSVREPS